MTRHCWLCLAAMLHIHWRSQSGPVTCVAPTYAILVSLSKLLELYDKNWGTQVNEASCTKSQHTQKGCTWLTDFSGAKLQILAASTMQHVCTDLIAVSACPRWSILPLWPRKDMERGVHIPWTPDTRNLKMTKSTQMCAQGTTSTWCCPCGSGAPQSMVIAQNCNAELRFISFVRIPVR